MIEQPVGENSFDLDFPACLEREFPSTFQIAWGVIEDVLAVSRGIIFSPLEKHSPGLAGFDWENYLRCSVVRMLKAAGVLHQQGVTGGKLLDVGAYFGNFSLMFARLGYDVAALDSYNNYGGALDPIVDLLLKSGVQVLDFNTIGYNLNYIDTSTYDIVLCMSVIEHIPHTPRFLLEGIERILKPGGVLVLDTPNLAYIYKRQQLERGESVFLPIASQYYTQIPFEGHHREYTASELKWMLDQIQHVLLLITMFNYSIYGLSEVMGTDLANYRLMEQNPEYREIILSVSRKKREKEK